MAVPHTQAADEVMVPHGADGVAHDDLVGDAEPPTTAAEPQAHVVVNVVDEELCAKAPDVVKGLDTAQGARGDQKPGIAHGGRLEGLTRVCIDDRRSEHRDAVFREFGGRGQRGEEVRSHDAVLIEGENPLAVAEVGMALR